jgi:cell division protein FtsQ
VKKTKKTGAAAKRRVLEEQRRNRRMWILAGIIVAAIAAQGLYLFAGSETFNVKAVHVAGNSRVTEAVIAKASGISAKTNIFRVDETTAVKNISANPWIASAEISRTWRLTVNIKVKERQPLAVVETAGLFRAVDKAGFVIESNPVNAYAGLPVIRDCPIKDADEPGDRLSEAAALNALRAAAGLDQELVAKLGWISAPSIDGMSLQLTNGPLVMYGKAEMQKQKNYAIKVILDQGANEGRSWQYIDVRVPSNPAAKPI